MKINKFMLIFMMSILLMGTAMAADLCTESTTYEQGSLTGLYNISTPTVHATNSEEQVGGIQEVLLTTAATLELCQNATILNGSTVTLAWAQTNYNITVNASRLMGNGDGGVDSNYTYNNATGILTWNFSGALEDGNNSEICYNKTFDVNEDIQDTRNGAAIFTLANTEYGDDGNFTLWAIELNNTPLDLNYSLNTRDCSIANSCRSTQTVIFSGFALLALFAIIVAAFAIIAVFNTGDTTAISVTLIASVIGLGIIIMIGYIIIANVGSLVCGI